MCQTKRQVSAEVNICQGSFDSNGFPIASSEKVAQLKAAIATAKQSNLDPNNDVEVQAVTKLLVSQMPFGNKYLKLRQLVQSLSEQSQSMSSSEVTQRDKEIKSTFLELINDPCFKKFQNALGSNGITDIPF